MSPSSRALVAAVSLSGLAGFVDALAFIYLGGYFVSFMSGNTTQGSVQLGQGDPAWLLALALVACFVLGVVVGTLVARVPRRREATIVTVVAALIAIAAVLVATPLPGTIGMLVLAVAMGAVNTLFARDGQTTLGLTYVTGALVKVGEGLVAAFSGGPRWGWVPSLLLWAGISAGAVLGALAYAVIGTAALWIAVVAAEAIAVAYLLGGRRRAAAA